MYGLLSSTEVLTKRRSIRIVRLYLDDDGKVVGDQEADADDYLALPRRMDKLFISSFLTQPASRVKELLDRLSFAELQRMLEVAEEEYPPGYRMAIVSWPHFVSPDGRWPEEQMHFVYHMHVGTDIIDDVAVTGQGHRLARDRDYGLVSAPQFLAVRGISIGKHLASSVDKFAEKAMLAQKVLQGSLRRARLSAVTAEGSVSSVTVVGPSAVPVSSWCLPEGQQFLAEE